MQCVVTQINAAYCNTRFRDLRSADLDRRLGFKSPPGTMKPILLNKLSWKPRKRPGD
jgi:hypothetical protein